MTTVLSAALKELIAAGLQGDSLVAAFQRIEAAVEPAVDKQAERRRAADRERKRNAIPQNSAESAETPPPLVPPLEVSPAPLPKTPPIIPPTTGLDLDAGEAFEAKLRKAAGWEREPAPGLFVTGPIEGLVTAGACLERDVLPVIRGLAPKVKRPASWKYFTEAIRDAWQARINAEATGPPLAQAVPFDATPNFGETFGRRQQTIPSPNSIAGAFSKVRAVVAEIERREREPGNEYRSGDSDEVPRLRQISP